MEGAGTSIKRELESVDDPNLCSDIIVDLLSVPFIQRPLEERILIKNRGRPTPSLVSLFKAPGKRSFNAKNWYQKFPWLAGSAKMGKVFCFPCLLYPSNGSELWWRKGYGDWKNIGRVAAKHELTYQHRLSAIKLQSLGEERIDITIKEFGSKHRRQALSTSAEAQSAIAIVKEDISDEDQDQLDLGANDSKGAEALGQYFNASMLETPFFAKDYADTHTPEASQEGGNTLAYLGQIRRNNDVSRNFERLKKRNCDSYSASAGGMIWCETSVRMLIREFAKRKDDYELPGAHKRSIWKDIAQELTRNGYLCKGAQCDLKWRAIKSFYRRWREEGGNKELPYYYRDVVKLMSERDLARKSCSFPRKTHAITVRQPVPTNKIITSAEPSTSTLANNEPAFTVPIVQMESKPVVQVDNSVSVEALQQAIEAKTKAYCPYSKFRVGCALVLPDGKVITGCNVENAAFGLTICAEKTAICKAISKGYRKFSKVIVSTDKDSFIFPCGGCRQFISEFSSDCDVIAVKSDMTTKTVRLRDLLPNMFTQCDL